MKIKSQSAWSQRRIVTELDLLQAQVAALKRLQAETAGRQGLHAPLGALLPAFLDRGFKGELRIVPQLQGRRPATLKPGLEFAKRTEAQVTRHKNLPEA